MKYLGMTIHCIGIVLSGIWFCGTVLNASWTGNDNVYRTNIKLDNIDKAEINSTQN